ncbi:hypothetical protein BKA66DRAFT_453223 [Pyrenochaeta sp. MPI-SDFR-AT-0127]|nr:hypothetical protein BKA66DRAFT_453223 [Pyrenochaeta sp. MPI-SDFR-AT-0127]
MHGRLIFLAASLVLRTFAAPLPANAVDVRHASVQEPRNDFSVMDLLPSFLKREPIIEAIPDAELHGIAESQRSVEARTRKTPPGGFKGRDIEARARKTPPGGFKGRDIEARARKTPPGGFKGRDIEARTRKTPPGGF